MNKEEGYQKISEAEISMVLDTYMYMNYQDAREGEPLGQIIRDLERHPDYAAGGIFHGEYTILREAVRNPEIGNLLIDCQSHQMGYDSGTAACAFLDPDGDSIYVAFRGTCDGEWPDNGLGLTNISTIQQRQALSYFEEAVDYLKVEPSQRLIVTGHSKGGNKAQYVTMETKYHHLLDVCYNVDGQGFSDVAIERWQEKYGGKLYAERQAKLFGIHGENDYVNVLGYSITPKDQIRYVKTPVDKTNFAGYHDIKYMFATQEMKKGTGVYKTIFHGRKNADAVMRGELGDYAATLSAMVMDTEPDKRDGCAAIVMQLMEATGGRKDGINGEKLTFSDMKDFITVGLPVVAYSLVDEWEGRAFLKKSFSQDAYARTVPGSIHLRLNYQVLNRQSQAIEEACNHISITVDELYKIKKQLARYMSSGLFVGYRIRYLAMNLEKLTAQLKKASQALSQISLVYQKWDCFLDSN